MTNSRLPKQLLGGPTRATFGITVTLRCLVTGQLESRHVTGPPRAALLELAAELDSRTDGVWVVQTYSTPQTIYNDYVRGRDHDPFGADSSSMPESSTLGQIGRMDLCAPELMSRDLRMGGQRVPKALRKQGDRLTAYAMRERAA